MEEIAWTPSERLAEFHKEAFKLILTSAVMFCLAILAFLGSTNGMLAGVPWFQTVSMFCVSIFFSLFGLYYLKRSLEQRELGKSLLMERENSIANESLLLLAEIGMELKRDGYGGRD